jgi:DnaJ family protein C protein 28
MGRVDDLIRKAIEEGQFDNLPGKGRPLRLDENPFEDPAWRMAHRILRDNGFSLPWIERRKEIEVALERAREDLSRAWRAHRGWQDSAKGAASRDEVWEGALQAFRERVLKINRRIRDYNLQTPSAQFQRRVVDSAAEIQAIMARDDLRGS